MSDSIMSSANDSATKLFTLQPAPPPSSNPWNLKSSTDSKPEPIASIPVVTSSSSKSSPNLSNSTTNSKSSSSQSLSQSLKNKKNGKEKWVPLQAEISLSSNQQKRNGKPNWHSRGDRDRSNNNNNNGNGNGRDRRSRKSSQSFIDKKDRALEEITTDNKANSNASTVTADVKHNTPNGTPAANENSKSEDSTTTFAENIIDKETPAPVPGPAADVDTEPVKEVVKEKSPVSEIAPTIVEIPLKFEESKSIDTTIGTIDDSTGNSYANQIQDYQENQENIKQEMYITDTSMSHASSRASQNQYNNNGPYHRSQNGNNNRKQQRRRQSQGYGRSGSFRSQHNSGMPMYNANQLQQPQYPVVNTQYYLPYFFAPPPAIVSQSHEGSRRGSAASSQGSPIMDGYMPTSPPPMSNQIYPSDPNDYNNPYIAPVAMSPAGSYVQPPAGSFVPSPMVQVPQSPYYPYYPTSPPPPMPQMAPMQYGYPPQPDIQPYYNNNNNSNNYNNHHHNHRNSQRSAPHEPRENDATTKLKKQIEYYFSIENLCKDLYLRKHMDSEGYVDVEFIGNFSRVKEISGGDVNMVWDAVVKIYSIEAKVVDSKRLLRLNDGWEKWILNSGGSNSKSKS